MYSIRSSVMVKSDMTGVYTNHYHPKNETESRILYYLCYHSARLRNTAVYNARQHFFGNDGAYIGDARLHADTRKNENYGYMICDMADQTINHVKRDFHSYYGAKKALEEEKRRNPDTWRRICLPKYLGKDDVWSFFVAGRSVRVKDDGIHAGLTERFRNAYGIKQRDLVLPVRLPLEGKHIAQLEVKPKFGGRYYDVTVVYTAEDKAEKEKGKEKSMRIMAGDVGVDNLLSFVTYPDYDAFIIKGGAVKAANQWYNKRKAEIQSIYDSQGIKGGSALVNLAVKREDFIDNEFGNIARKLVDYAEEHRITHIVIGWNNGIKQGIDIGKVNNQKFVTIPYQKLFQKIRSAAEATGIVFETIGESHTSKCSAIDREEVCHHEMYIGKRISRGRFRTNDGTVINADINGAANILRLYLGSKGKRDISPRFCRALSTGQVWVLERSWIIKRRQPTSNQTQAPSSVA